MDTASLLNCSGFFTGDMGTEQSLPFLKKSLRKLFGRWIVDEDNRALDARQDGLDVGGDGGGDASRYRSHMQG